MPLEIEWGNAAKHSPVLFAEGSPSAVKGLCDFLCVDILSVMPPSLCMKINGGVINPSVVSKQKAQLLGSGSSSSFWIAKRYAPS